MARTARASHNMIRTARYRLAPAARVCRAGASTPSGIYARAAVAHEGRPVLAWPRLRQEGGELGVASRHHTKWRVRMIKGLHHNAYRCRDSEETRGFYEDFLGLRFVSAFEIDEGRGLHSFFEMDDGSCLAFFEVPGRPFDFKRQDSLDLHIALGVEPDVFDRM